jgi:hypothetical protein
MNNHTFFSVGKDIEYLVSSSDIVYYDVSYMKLGNNSYGILEGTYRTSTRRHPSILESPSEVMELALRSYDKLAFFVSNGYRADLYDMKYGWATDFWEGEGNYQCQLTITQARNFQQTDRFPEHNYRITVNYDDSIGRVNFSEEDIRWLTQQWDIGNDASLFEHVRNSLNILNRSVWNQRMMYLNVHVKEGEYPRTLFEF